MSQVIAVLGATTNKAYELLNILDERNFPVAKIHALSTEDHIGRSVSFGDKTINVVDATKFDFKEHAVSLVFACGDIEETKKFLPKAAKAGAVCIDMTPTFRMDPDVPLLVPEANPTAIKDMKKNIIASPSAVSTMLSIALKPLNEAASIKRLVISTYQSTSGQGRAAMDELFSQTKALFMNSQAEPQEFPKQIAFNVIPQVSAFMEDGGTFEEWMILTEIKKILSPKIKLSCTCVRVPTFVGDAASVNIEFNNELTAIEAAKILSTSTGLGVLEDPEDYVTPEETAGEDLVFVSRIRDDISVDNGLSMWVATDTMRKGSALNAVQIAELWVGNKK